MRAHEFIQEGKNKTALRKSPKGAIPNLEVWPDLDNNNHPYLAYRFGIAMAGAPDDDMDRNGPIGSNFTTIGYTDADKEITDHAAKIMGVKPSKLSNGKSTELKSANNVSPVPDRNKLKK